jgi:hypothetical protein
MSRINNKDFEWRSQAPWHTTPIPRGCKKLFFVVKKNQNKFKKVVYHYLCLDRDDIFEFDCPKYHDFNSSLP